jgi:hypothetical protein
VTNRIDADDDYLPTVDPVERVRELVEVVKFIRDRHSGHGADDTEPGYITHAIFRDAITGRPVNVPTTGRDWCLYTCTDGFDRVAKELAEATSAAVKAIVDAREKATAPQFREVVVYLKDHCWRVGDWRDIADLA